VIDGSIQDDIKNVREDRKPRNCLIAVADLQWGALLAQVQPISPHPVSSSVETYIS
jgi:hypothetical protein